MKNIAFFLRNFAGGGAERVAVNLANELSKKYNVFILVVKREGPYLSKVSERVNIVTLDSTRLITSSMSLAKKIKEHQIDVLVSNMTHENIVAAGAKLFAKFKLLAVEHNNLEQEIKGRGKVTYFATMVLYRLVYRLFNELISVSEGVGAAIKQRFPKASIHTIHNPIIEDNILRCVDALPFDHSTTPKKGICFVGRLSEQKDPAFAVKVFAELVTQYHYTGKLFLLGEGPLLDEVKALAHRLGVAEQVECCGFVDNPYHYMAQSEILMLTSKWEGFGNVIVESLFVGTKVVSIDCDYGPAEIITQPEVGRLVSNRDVSEFAKIMNEELDNTQYSDARVLRANEFAVEQVAHKYELLF